jgi:nucleotide-binding universal stress UspA family protein
MRVLVAIESSPMTEAVISDVESRSWPSDTVFCVLNVIDSRAVNSDFVDVVAFAQTRSEAALDFVKSVAGRLQAHGLEAYAEVVEGYPRTDIVEFALRWKADLIIVGARRHLSVTDFLLGSVATNVVRSAPCSVEVIRTGSSERRNGMRVLVATDGSDSSIAAVRSIISRPWREGTDFKVISIIDRAFLDLAWFFNQQIIERIDERMTDEAKANVRVAIDLLKSAGLSVTGTALSGKPGTEIIEQARSWDADLIVVGSHGRRLIDRALQGSVSEAVAMRAQCSVEVIRGVCQAA